MKIWVCGEGRKNKHTEGICFMWQLVTKSITGQWYHTNASLAIPFGTCFSLFIKKINEKGEAYQIFATLFWHIYAGLTGPNKYVVINSVEGNALQVTL